LSTPINRYINNYAKTNDTITLKKGKIYYEQIRCFNNADTADWSTTASFTTIQADLVPTVPFLSTPADKSKNAGWQTLVLTWVSVGSGFYYDIQVSSDTQFVFLLFSTNNNYSTGVSYNNLSPGSVYYWRVRAKNATYTSDWSKTFSFTTQFLLNTPQNLYPSFLNKVSPIYVRLGWWGVTMNVRSYEVQVGNSSKLENEPVQQAEFPFFELRNLNLNKLYYWRVRAVGVNFIDRSAWSETAVFMTGVLGEEEIHNRTKPFIYPNPAFESLYISDEMKVDKIEVYDGLGKMVISKEMPELIDRKIDIADLPAGIYLLKAFAGDDLYTTTLVKAEK
jgi:hypothetical protein